MKWRDISIRLFATAIGAFVLGGCATQHPYDYTAFKRDRPKSILVLPPVNKSPEVVASYSFLSHVTYPLAESGYYVFPVAVVDESFRQNGLSTPEDIQSVAPAKLREVFGADAALYIEITQYGTRYMVLSSETVVAANARLIDLRTGDELWKGSAIASDNEGQNNNSGGVIGMLVAAAVKQVVNTVSNQGHQIAGITSARLLTAGGNGAILYGPRSPKYGKDGVVAQ